MIYYIIFFLLLVLLLLFVDWSTVLRRFQKNRPTREYAPRVQTNKTDNSLPASDWFAPADSPPSVTELFDMAAVIAPEPSTQYSSEVEGFLAEADVHFRKGEMKAAEQLYLKAAAKDPRCSKAYSRLGVIYLENGESYQDAEDAFRQALKTDPNNGFILNNLGLVLYHQDKYADAIRQFEQAVRHDEMNASRQANLGMAYMAMRQYAKAESAFKKALKLAPSEMEYKDLLNESIEKKKAHKTMIRR